MPYNFGTQLGEIFDSITDDMTTGMADNDDLSCKANLWIIHLLTIH